MGEAFESKTRQLKAELQVARQASELWKILIEKRETLECKISQLINEIDANKTIMHSNTSRDSNLRKVIECKEELLEKIKLSKKEIDEKLDDLEGISDEIVGFLKNQLILAILQNYPEQEIEFKTLDLNRSISEKLAKEIKTLAELIRGILELNKKVIQDARQPKFFQFLNFFFGRSRYFTVQRHLQHLQMACGKTLDFLHGILESTETYPDISNQLEELGESIVQLHLFTQKRYKNRSVDQILAPLDGVIKEQLKQTIRNQKLVDEIFDAQLEKIDQWIERHT